MQVIQEHKNFMLSVWWDTARPRQGAAHSWMEPCHHNNDGWPGALLHPGALHHGPQDAQIFSMKAFMLFNGEQISGRDCSALLYCMGAFWSLKGCVPKFGGWTINRMLSGLQLLRGTPKLPFCCWAKTAIRLDLQPKRDLRVKQRRLQPWMIRVKTRSCASKSCALFYTAVPSAPIWGTVMNTILN